ncbi:hypothetical protein [Paraburkholderia sp. BCC1885]|uniref:hypothetical protein n=1 Tax=Paraburkholderia sp. BCC1885 TaxID=2562669 RepID=UPI0011825BD2|nr:hypothetical protein [Paraburkholderia sp. BCC1885]
MQQHREQHRRSNECSNERGDDAAANYQATRSARHEAPDTKRPVRETLRLASSHDTLNFALLVLTNQ